MSWQHKAKHVASAARHYDMAQRCAKLLRAAGIRANVLDVRDRFGARFEPVNLLVLGEIRVMVRPAGWQPAPTSDDRTALAAGAWLQLGCSATHVAPLIERCRLILANPWPSNPQTGTPLLLKK